MPAASETQRRAACVALSIKRGETARSYAKSKEILGMVDSMSEQQLKDYCESKVAKVGEHG